MKKAELSDYIIQSSVFSSQVSHRIIKFQLVKPLHAMLRVTGQSRLAPFLLHSPIIKVLLILVMNPLSGLPLKPYRQGPRSVELQLAFDDQPMTAPRSNSHV